MPPPSLKAMQDRGNEFIYKIKEAGVSEETRAEARAKASARGKAKAKAKGEAKQQAQRRATRKPKQIEPEFATLEEALEAAKLCKKCLPTKFGTKGCRACMGDFFEEIRQKGKPEKPEKP